MAYVAPAEESKVRPANGHSYADAGNAKIAASSPKISRKDKAPLRQRWRMLAILSVDICVSYLPWYTFVPIMSQSMSVYSATASDLNVLCIIYSLVYVPSVFLSGTVLSTLGCHWCFTLATSCVAAGCVLRCGPDVHSRFFSMSSWVATTAVPEQWPPTVAPFAWLAAGQALCAVGQTFLVNSTSHLAAEWFMADERPAAAMISNLMNFLGGCFSFMQPTWYVSEEGSLESTTGQVTQLMDSQLKISLAALVLTVLLYRDAPFNFNGVERAETPLFSELWQVLTLRDFWLVNGQFILYLTVLNTFDAVEGSLLANYGYSEALSSWTAVSFVAGALVSTAFESAIIRHPAHYRTALISINGVLAASLILGLFSLRAQLPEAGFVIAVGVMGLSTPGWGCAVEMGSEVCYPAREATVSSLLEAFGSLASIGGIIIAQHLIDTGKAFMVFVLMAIGSLAGSLALLGLSGRLHRREAEDVELLSEADDDLLGSPQGLPPPVDTSVSYRGRKMPAWASFQDV
mmetsp:Transcript_12368/g.19652  ORF Transcript_12368/g.19652 Transcript_12368/m.19652 type:complete len:517 (-) Transcript_12368:52-1602(-)